MLLQTLYLLYKIKVEELFLPLLIASFTAGCQPHIAYSNVNTFGFLPTSNCLQLVMLAHQNISILIYSICNYFQDVNNKFKISMPNSIFII